MEPQLIMKRLNYLPNDFHNSRVSAITSTEVMILVKSIYVLDTITIELYNNYP